MSLTRLRRSSRVVAALLLLVSAFGVPHRSQIEDVCVPSGVEAHDESKHVFTSAGELDHSQHCAVCHWLRWMKPVFSPAAFSVNQLGTGTDLVSFTAQGLRDPASDQLPARAPPLDA